MARKLIGIFILFLFFLVNVVVLSASPFMKEIMAYTMQNTAGNSEQSVEDDILKIAELDEFLNSELLFIGDVNVVVESNYIYDFESILNIHISLPYPPPNFLA